MNQSLLATTAALLLFALGAQAQAPGGQSQLDLLKARHQQDVNATIKPIQDRYILKLKALMTRLTQSGDLDGAHAVELELKRLGAQ
jgi:hypothetical protein